MSEERMRVTRREVKGGGRAVRPEDERHGWPGLPRSTVRPSVAASPV
jgi:hypothetical protein